jgi:hypothetical protein
MAELTTPRSMLFGFAQSRLVALAREKFHLDVHLSDSQGVCVGVRVTRVVSEALGGGSEEGNRSERDEDQQGFH